VPRQEEIEVPLPAGRSTRASSERRNAGRAGTESITSSKYVKELSGKKGHRGRNREGEGKEQVGEKNTKASLGNSPNLGKAWERQAAAQDKRKGPPRRYDYSWGHTQKTGVSVQWRSKPPGRTKGKNKNGNASGAIICKGIVQTSERGLRKGGKSICTEDEPSTA